MGGEGEKPSSSVHVGCWCGQVLLALACCIVMGSFLNGVCFDDQWGRLCDQHSAITPFEMG